MTPEEQVRLNRGTRSALLDRLRPVIDRLEDVQVDTRRGNGCMYFMDSADAGAALTRLQEAPVAGVYHPERNRALDFVLNFKLMEYRS